MTTEQLALPTTETAKPAPKVTHGRWNAETKRPEPLWPDGTRMVYNDPHRPDHEMNGRHGFIRHSVMAIRSIMLSRIATDDPSTDYSISYEFISDAGAKAHAWDAEKNLTPETETATFAPDPILHGDRITPQALARNVVSARRSAAGALSCASRRRIREKADADRKLAAHYKLEAAELSDQLVAWLEANPGEAARLKEHKDIREALGVPAAPVAPTATGPSGATVSINEELNGVEVRFPAKPDESTIGALKSHGFRWSMRSRCWYHRRDEASEAFARSLAA